MPRSKKGETHQRQRSKPFKSIKRKTYLKPHLSKKKTKTHKKQSKIRYLKKTKTHKRINSQLKTIEYPDFQNTSEWVGKDLRNKVIHGNNFTRTINAIPRSI